MRHQRKRHKLGRSHAHRKATLAALSTALISHKRITTTVTRAKALRTYVEPLLNRAKVDSTHNRREVFRHLQNKEAVTELFNDVAERIGDRPGGYTRVVKLGRRAGDAAEMAVIELVDYNDVRPGGASGGGRRRRTRRGSSGGGGRRRSGQKTAGQASAGATATAVQTSDQVTGGHGVESDVVEAPAAPEQQEPVVERTEPQAEAKAAAAEVAEEGAQDVEVEAETVDAQGADVAEVETEPTTEPEAEAETKGEAATEAQAETEAEADVSSEADVETSSATDAEEQADDEDAEEGESKK